MITIIIILYLWRSPGSVFHNEEFNTVYSHYDSTHNIQKMLSLILSTFNSYILLEIK